MKKMNKMYQAPKVQVIELNVNKDFMAGGWSGASVETQDYGDTK